VPVSAAAVEAVAAAVTRGRHAAGGSMSGWLHPSAVAGSESELEEEDPAACPSPRRSRAPCFIAPPTHGGKEIS